MPTTRLTAGKTAIESDGSASPMKESSIESRKENFDAKKRREPLADPTPKQRIMIQFLDAILKYLDRFFILIYMQKN